MKGWGWWTTTTKGEGFLLAGPICKATKSIVFPLVLFMVLGRDGLGRRFGGKAIPRAGVHAYTYEMYACRVHACEINAYKVHAYL